ncbi:MAG: hypothetical protein U0R17_02030 [Acidimicrobiia bacterium]
MDKHISRPEINQWSDGDLYQAAADVFAEKLFSYADDDSQFHAKVADILNELRSGKNLCDSDEIAIRILAWSSCL